MEDSKKEKKGSMMKQCKNYFAQTIIAALYAIALFSTFALLSSQAFASSCNNSVTLGAHYYGHGESQLDEGLLNYEKGWEALRQGDTEDGCDYLSYAQVNLNTSIDSLYLASGEFNTATSICTGSSKNEAQTKLGYVQQLMTESSYYKELIDQEYLFSCNR